MIYSLCSFAIAHYLGAALVRVIPVVRHFFSDLTSGAHNIMDSKTLIQLEKAVGDFATKFGGRLEEHADELVALRQQIVALAQKGQSMPFSLGGGDDSIMPVLEASDAFKSLLRGESKNARIAIPAKALQRKANITSAITGGTIAPADRFAGIIAPSQRRVWVRDLLPSVPTTGGATEFVREATFTNNAAPQGGTVMSPATIGEGELKNASDMTLELVSFARGNDRASFHGFATGP